MHKKYNEEMDLYGVYNHLGKQIIPMVLSSVYSETSEGRQQYKMTNVGKTIDLIKWVDTNVNLEELNNE